MFGLVDKLIENLGDVYTVARRAAVFAYVGWATVVLFGCAGWWTPQFCALVCLVAVAAHLVAVRARTLLGTGDGV